MEDSTEAQYCTDEMRSQNSLIWWLTLFATLVPTLFNLVAIFTSCYLVYMLFSLIKLAQATTVTSHYFLETAIQAGIGPTFKEKLNEHASSEEELKILIQPVARC